MLKLKLLHFDSDGKLTSMTHCGQYRSYIDIAKHLKWKGKTGKYCVIPSRLSNIAPIREITVTKDKYGKIVEMEGSIY